MSGLRFFSGPFSVAEVPDELRNDEVSFTPNQKQFQRKSSSFCLTIKLASRIKFSVNPELLVQKFECIVFSSLLAGSSRILLEFASLKIFRIFLECFYRCSYLNISLNVCAVFFQSISCVSACLLRRNGF